MALVGNMSVLHKSPAKYTTGTVGYGDRANWNKPGMMRSRGNTTVSTLWKYDAIPSGMYAGRAFFPPKTAGAMVARESIGMAATALAVGGITANATASFALVAANATMYPLDDTSPLRTGAAAMTFTVADATGGLIASAEGSAAMTFTVADLLLTASINATGSTSFTVSTNTPILGAQASGAGAALFSFTATCSQVLPLNDAPPLRDGAANFAITGSLTPYAIGSMSGSTVDASVLTTSGIANEVWSSVAANFTTSGTMGAKLNTASSGGVDYDSMATATALAVRANLAAELARIDAAITTRATPGDVFAAV